MDYNCAGKITEELVREYNTYDSISMKVQWQCQKYDTPCPEAPSSVKP
jgi:hypothetical protein